MALIYHLVRIKQNTHGQLEPVNRDYCPLYKDKKEISVCQDGDNYCVGIQQGNVIKQLDSITYLIQCNYFNVTKRSK